MAFNLFGKKKEIVDFRPRDSDMPIPAKMKDKFGIKNQAVSPSFEGLQSSSSSSTIPSNQSSQSTGGGFFNFFGGSSDASPATTSSPVAEVKTDFWGNPVQTNNEPVSNPSSTDSTYKLSHITDRLELIEKKLERLERKMGIGTSS